MVHLREHLEEEEGKAFKEVEVKNLLVCGLDAKNTLLCSSHCWTTVIRLDKSSANSGTVTLLYTFCAFLSSRYTPAQPSLSCLSVPLSSPWWLNVCGELGACICKCAAHSEIPIDSGSIFPASGPGRCTAFICLAVMRRGKLGVLSSMPWFACL